MTTRFIRVENPKNQNEPTASPAFEYVHVSENYNSWGHAGTTEHQLDQTRGHKSTITTR